MILTTLGADVATTQFLMAQEVVEVTFVSTIEIEIDTNERSVVLISILLS